MPKHGGKEVEQRSERAATQVGPKGLELLEEGTWGHIVGLRFPNGDCPSLEFLLGLQGKEQVGLKARMVTLAATGTQKTPENFRKLEVDGDPPVFELKHTALNLRLYLIKGDRVYYATHGRKKPKDRQVAKEVKRARELWKEWSS